MNPLVEVETIVPANMNLGERERERDRLLGTFGSVFPLHFRTQILFSDSQRAYLIHSCSCIYTRHVTCRFPILLHSPTCTHIHMYSSPYAQVSAVAHVFNTLKEGDGRGRSSDAPPARFVLVSSFMTWARTHFSTTSTRASSR